jgi:hypothetical protein
MNPEIIFVPNTEDLKEFRDTIGNKLCYFEESLPAKDGNILKLQAMQMKLKTQKKS